MPGWTRCSSATTTRPAPCTSRTPRCSAACSAAWNPDVTGALFLLPLWNPVLVAEQIGTLAALTEGRFVMQCGIGSGRAQFAAMGVDVKDRRRLFEHHLAVVRALLAGEEVDGVRIAPVPSEPVDVWIGATAPAAIERAARLGDGWLAAPALTLEQAARQIDGYRAACDGWAGRGARP